MSRELKELGKKLIREFDLQLFAGGDDGGGSGGSGQTPPSRGQETFSADYVRDLRNESAEYRTKLRAAETARETAEVKLKALSEGSDALLAKAREVLGLDAQSDLTAVTAKLVETVGASDNLTQKAQEALRRAAFLAAAAKANVIDVDAAYKLADLKSVKTDLESMSVYSVDKERFDETAVTIGRRADDIYRTLALENVRGSVTGYKTWEQAAKGFREQLAEQGVTGFKDARGRQWNMRTYSEMVARTATMEAHLEGTKNRLWEHGYDLVIISRHPGACELCLPWEGEVLSLTGKTPGYPTMKEAEEAGLFHPNCRHTFSLYVERAA